MKPDKHPPSPQRRVYPEELKKEAVQMLLDGHSAPSVARNLGIRHTSLLYRWKAQALGQQGHVALPLGAAARGATAPHRAGARHPKKSLGHFQPGDLKEVYPVITHLEDEGFPVAAVCQALGVSRAGYYTHTRGQAGPREREDARLRLLVRQIFWEHKRRYGARRIAAELAAHGEGCGPDRVARLLKQLGLQAIQPRSFRPRTTQSRHPLGYSPNLLLEAPPPSGINQVWLGDITFVPLAGGRFAYLALLLDLYSRRVVGWELDEHMAEPLVLAVLRQAIAGRQPGPGLIRTRLPSLQVAPEASPRT
jgi:transposase-like protein